MAWLFYFEASWASLLIKLNQVAFIGLVSSEVYDIDDIEGVTPNGMEQDLGRGYRGTLEVAFMRLVAP